MIYRSRWSSRKVFVLGFTTKIYLNFLFLFSLFFSYDFNRESCDMCGIGLTLTIVRLLISLWDVRTYYKQWITFLYEFLIKVRSFSGSCSQYRHFYLDIPQPSEKNRKWTFTKDLLMRKSYILYLAWLFVVKWILSTLMK